jgi:hypothetical protein
MLSYSRFKCYAEYQMLSVVMLHVSIILSVMLTVVMLAIEAPELDSYKIKQVASNKSS